MNPWPERKAAVRRMGGVTWKISEKSTMPGKRPSPVGRKTCVRIGPEAVASSTDSGSRIVMGLRQSKVGDSSTASCRNRRLSRGPSDPSPGPGHGTAAQYEVLVVADARRDLL